MNCALGVRIVFVLELRWHLFLQPTVQMITLTIDRNINNYELINTRNEGHAGRI